MKKFIFITLCFLIPLIVYAGINDRESKVNLLDNPDVVELPEITAPSGNPSANTLWLYSKDSGGTSKFYIEQDDGTITDVLSSLSSVAWDDITNPDANKTITFSTYTNTMTGAHTAADGFTFQNTGNFGDISVVKIQQATGNPTDGTVLEVISGDTDADAFIATANSVNVISVNGDGTLTVTGNTDITGTFDVTGASTLTGDLTVTGTASLGTLYQQAIVAAAAGNVNLTLDAAGTGTITLGGTSTGKITTDNLVELFGNTDIGDAASDTLTITSSIDGNVTLDDGSGASPSLIFIDATDETATFSKADSGNISVTTVAADSFQVLTGNLRVGNGTPGTASMDGEDAYIEGESEFDGAMTVDGNAAFNGTVTTNSTIAANGETTFTFGAAEDIIIDATTTTHTATDGVIDLGMKSITDGAEALNAKAIMAAGGGGGENIAAIYVDLDDDADAAGNLRGIEINASDATGSATIQGIRITSTIEQGINHTMAAAAQSIIIDAATNDLTNTDGIIDIDADSVTNGTELANIDLDVGDTGAGVTTKALYIDLDDDTSSNAATIHGIDVNGSDLTGHASTVVTALYVTSADVAVQADKGYIRIGTGSSPDVTPGDDDLYVEGTIEVDGQATFDGAIDADSNMTLDGNFTGDGDGQIEGFVSQVEDVTGANSIAITECGRTYTNTGAVGQVVQTLPEASTAIGCKLCFAVTAAQQHNINPNDGVDQILGLTDAAGDSVQSNAAGDYLCVEAVGNDAWVVTATNNSTNNADGWADAN
jgi:cytoskeletal protein CcmA (bactofilin family)